MQIVVSRKFSTLKVNLIYIFSNTQQSRAEDDYGSKSKLYSFCAIESTQQMCHRVSSHRIDSALISGKVLSKYFIYVKFNDNLHINNLFMIELLHSGKEY